jgi:hypothetical protein
LVVLAFTPGCTETDNKDWFSFARIQKGGFLEDGRLSSLSTYDSRWLSTALERSLGLRMLLEGYLRGETMTKVYSLVAAVPFSPVDVDLNILARGEWDAVKDRMRIWFLPRTDGPNDKPSCYVMIRKFDQRQAVLVCVHIVMNLDVGEEGDQPLFTIGILSNDDIRARAVLGVFLGVPPIFHRRSEITLIEGKWRDDPGAVMRYAANRSEERRVGKEC